MKWPADFSGFGNFGPASAWTHIRSFPEIKSEISESTDVKRDFLGETFFRSSSPKKVTPIFSGYPNKYHHCFHAAIQADADPLLSSYTYLRYVPRAWARENRPTPCFPVLNESSFESHIAHTLRADAPATILHRKRVHLSVEVGSRGNPSYL